MNYTRKCIDSLPFGERPRNALREAERDDRDELYARLATRYGMEASHRLWADLKNFLSSRQIFFQPEIFAAFDEMQNELFAVIVHWQTYVEDDEPMPLSERIATSRQVSVTLNEQADRLAEKIRGRFGF